MVEKFESLDSTVIIGTHSGGLRQFGNVGWMILPNSKFSVLSGWRGFNSIAPEGVGFGPDYYSASDDLVKVAKQFLFTGGTGEMP
jgi:hypothetical protein